MDWRPIDTLPTDGTLALLYFSRGSLHIGGRCDMDGEFVWQDSYRELIPGGWGHLEGEPTHWTPLPELPAGWRSY